MPDRIVLVMAKRAGRWIAGAINFIGSDALFGRHWGAIEHHPFLHFELCYYQAIEFAIAESALGLAAIAATEKGVCAILFGRDADALRNDLEARFPRAQLKQGGAKIGSVAKNVLAFVANPRKQPTFTLDMSGTSFQRKVWQALRAIPAGATASYAQIAKQIGEPSAARAVAQACSANPLAVVVPCHRIVRSDGSLSGYRWGPECKRALLAREVSA